MWTHLPSNEKIKLTETLETPKEELTTGSIFSGRYQIIKELERGGMGRIHKVLDKEAKEKIALRLTKFDSSAGKIPSNTSGMN